MRPGTGPSAGAVSVTFEAGSEVSPPTGCSSPRVIVPSRGSVAGGRLPSPPPVVATPVSPPPVVPDTSSKAPPMAARPTSAAMTSRTRTTKQPHPRPRRRGGEAGFQPGTAPGAAVGQEPGTGWTGGGAGNVMGGGTGWTYVGADRDTGGGAGWIAALTGGGAGWTGAGAPTGEPAGPARVRPWSRGRPVAARRIPHRNGRSRPSPCRIDRNTGPSSRLGLQEVSGRTTPMIRRCRTPSIPRSTPYRRTSVRNRCSRVAAGSAVSPVCTGEGWMIVDEGDTSQ